MLSTCDLGSKQTAFSDEIIPYPHQTPTPKKTQTPPASLIKMNVRNSLKPCIARKPLTPHSRTRLQEMNLNVNNSNCTNLNVANTRKEEGALSSTQKVQNKIRKSSNTSNKKLSNDHHKKSSSVHNNSNNNYHNKLRNSNKPAKLKRNVFRRLGRAAKDSSNALDIPVTSVRQRESQCNELLLPEEYHPDPLTCLIEAHNTQKVRFNLSRNMVNDQSTICSSVSNSSSANEELMNQSTSVLSTTRSSNIKKLMKRVLKKNSNDVEEECNFSKNLTTSVKNLAPPSDTIGLKTSFSSSSCLSSLLRPQSKTSSTSSCSNIYCKASSPLKEFKENRNMSTLIKSHIQKGEKAQFMTFNYPTAGKHYLAAMQALNTHSYPDNHSLRLKTLKLLNDVQHSRRSLEYSCQIVKIGLEHEEKMQYVKALKMYTIAYRIRRDALGKQHPSLPVLLNMLGSVQVKQGDLDEAMQIFKLALNGRLEDGSGDVKIVLGVGNVAPWTRSTTLMEMGIIYEKWGNVTMALEMYHESLSCVIKGFLCRVASDSQVLGKVGQSSRNSIKAMIGDGTLSPSYLGSQEIRLVRTTSLPLIGTYQNEEMEAYLDGGEGDSTVQNYINATADPCGFYDSIFHKERPMESKSVNINVAMTLYYIGNLRRKSGNLKEALCAYQAAYRGMVIVLGAKHTNVAAILGNIGNCHKEMKNYDEAYNIYQKVLRIESLHFGLGHPEVIVTMHNIAMIEKCRGNYKEAISLYREVLILQKKRLGSTHESVTVTSSCLADVYEISGNYESAITVYKEIISLKCEALNDKFHPDLAVLYHSCAMVYAKNNDIENACAMLRKTVRLYEHNKINNDSYLNAQRDAADMHAKLAFLPGKK